MRIGSIALLGILIAGAAISVPAEGASAGPAPGKIGATYIDPYSVYNASEARLDRMFTAQKRVGITTAIVQWTGYIYPDGTLATTYPASSATKFKAFDTVLPRILKSAKRHQVRIWLGLALRPNVFDDASTKNSAKVFQNDLAKTQRLAKDLLLKYRGQFVGWYLPSEPGYQTIASSTTLAQQTTYLKGITTKLRQLQRNIPTMISPCVPRAIEGGLSGVAFIDKLSTMMRGAGIDVWNIQDGHAMTAWTPTENLALLERSKKVAATAGVKIWATLYTPGPDDPGAMSEAGLFSDLNTIQSAGVPMTVFTFDGAFNPDASRGSSAHRALLYKAYAKHIGANV